MCRMKVYRWRSLCWTLSV